MMIEALFLFWLITLWLKIVNLSQLLERLNNLLSIAHINRLYFPRG